MESIKNHDNCGTVAAALAQALCAEKGVRLTEQRAAILRLLWRDCRRPVKAYDLLEALKTETGSTPKPPTVYRALDFLLKHRLIHRLDSLNAYIGCHHPEKCHDCYFLICRDCGIAEECCTESLQQAVHSTAETRDFTPEHTTLEIHGICTQCSSTQATLA